MPPGEHQMVMKKGNIKPPSVVRLKYKKGELVIKEGDYGVSVYKITKGEVHLFTCSGEKETTLARLGPGEIIGEMAFFNKGIEARTHSARAAKDSELEIWHPDFLLTQYNEMPSIIRVLTDEAVSRLFRMNTLITQMVARSEEEKTSDKQALSRRSHYRKEVDLPCTYRPVDSSPRLRLNGIVKNISLTGINVEVKGKTMANFPHDPGDAFCIDLTLPNGKDIHVTSRLLSFRKPRFAGMLSMGMVFADMKEGTKKELGFFLMP